MIQVAINNLAEERRIDIKHLQETLRFRYSLENDKRTDYAWHFNSGQKLDLLMDDVNMIKEKMNLTDNFTYAGPNR